MKQLFLALLVLCLMLTLMVFISSCSDKKEKAFSELEWEKTIDATKVEDLYALHVKEGKYYSPWLKMPDKKFFEVLGWKLFSKSTFTKEEKVFLPDIRPNTADRLKKTKGNYILWIGHNTFLIKVNNTAWLTDPIFSKRALLPPRVTPPAINIDEFNDLFKDINILISHNHYDHLDRPSMKKLPQKANVFVPKGLKKYIEKMNKENVQQMDWWEEFDLGNGSKLVCLPAQHWSLRINQGRYKSLWASWLLITPETSLYFGGDSGYFKGFKEIGKKYPNIDYAFMATTAYIPRWFMHYAHMNVEESVLAFNDLGARFFIPTQWGTFKLGSEPAGYPGLDLQKYLTKNNLDRSKFKVLDIGEIISINE